MKRLHLWLIVFLLIGVSEVESQEFNQFLWLDFEEHTNVKSVSSSPNGLILASGSFDNNTVVLWDMATQQHIATLEGHADRVESVSFSPDGSILASGSTDKTVILWDVAKRQRIMILACQTAVRSVAFSFDGSLLAAGQIKGVELWNTSEWGQPPEQETPVVEGDDEFLQTSLEAPGLSMVSGDNQEGTPNEPLPHPFVVLAYNADGTVLTGLSVTFTVVSGDGTVNPTNVITDEEGIAKSTLTLGTSLDPHIVDVSAPGIPIVIGFWAFPKDNSPLPQIDADVNDDGVVDVIDLAIVALNYGRQNVIHAHGDVNADGAVDVNDLLAVAAVIDGGAAPSARDQAVEVFTAEQVAHWLGQAMLASEGSFDYRRGVQFLEGVLALLTPKETALLVNFPNPFNPETWLPYHLAETADVQISIYNTAGALIRRLDMGHQDAGFYIAKGQAAYWDGRNEDAELVASGVYFYQLRAGNFSQMRRMLVVK